MSELEVLGRDRLDILKSFLAKDPVQNVYALGLLEEHGLSGKADSTGVAFLALVAGGRVVAGAVVGGRGALVVPCATDLAAATRLGQALAGTIRLRSAIGERFAVDALCRAMGEKAKVSRPLRLFSASADDLGPFGCAELRLAAPSDVAPLSELTAAALLESFGAELGVQDPARLSRRIEARVAAARTYVLCDRDRILAKLDVGARSRYGAELEGLYVIPEARRQGHATRVLGQVSRSLLGSLPRLTVRVDEASAGLSAVCRAVGYASMRPQRLLIVE